MTPAPGATPARGDRIIEIAVSPTGDVTVQTKGFVGSSCRDASRFIEQALGKATGERLTSEFHQAQTKTEQNTRQM